MAKTKQVLTNINEAVIIEKVHVIRGVKVMLDKDLAEMYNVETFRLNEAVKRKISRFPSDFMFQLTKEEYGTWWNKKTSLRFYRTGRCHAFLSAEFRYGS